jgi:transcriptional regulator
VYVPAHFAEDRNDVLQQLIADHPLGTLVTLGSNGLMANLIPFLFEATSEPHGRLIGHVARSNDLWHDRVDGVDSLVVFQGASAYISPNWYVTKQRTHEVVPTYNYVVAQIHGPLIIHEDAKWLRGAVGKLTKAMESVQSEPWKMADAPSAFIAAQLENIVGIEIPISRITGKWKTSQNRPVEDRRGAIDALRATGVPDDVAMADLIERTISST